MKPQSDIDELKNMQREAAEQRDKRKKHRAKASIAEGQQSPAGQDQKRNPKPAENDQANEAKTENLKAGEDDQIYEAQAQETENDIQDIADQIEIAVKNMDELASERPVLTLLAAFTLGIVVGQMFSRK